MKKISIVIITLLVCFCANAQGHMKFMGIPMGISISSFQTKLAAKGIKYDPVSRQLKDAVKVYKGKFAGYDASIYVYYDSKTKLVYRGKACIERSTEELADMLILEIASMLSKKYGIDHMYYSEDEEAYSVFSDEGQIDLYKSKEDADYFIHIEDYYTIHIDYYDDAAQDQNIKSRMDDL